MSATNGRTRAPRVPLVNPTVSPLPAPAPEPAPASAATPNLDAAVLRVQAQAAKLVRNATGQIQNRQYGYVTLDAVTDEVLPLLVSEELLWKTFPTALDGEPALRYRMTHVPSGEFDEDTMLLLCDRTAQGQGSGNTYARRYSVIAYLNLTVGDDDGASANTPGAVTTVIANAQAQDHTHSVQPTAAPAKPSDRPASVKQRSMLRAKAGAAGLEPSVFANVIMIAAGEKPRQWEDEEAAAQTLGRLVDRLPARLVDAVIAGIEAS